MGGEEEPNLRRRIDSELGGVVYHAEERVRGAGGDGDDGDGATLWATPVADFLSGAARRARPPSAAGGRPPGEGDGGRETTSAVHVREGALRAGAVAARLLGLAIDRLCRGGLGGDGDGDGDGEGARIRTIRHILAAALAALGHLPDGGGVESDVTREENNAALPPPLPPRRLPRPRPVGPAPVGIDPRWEDQRRRIAEERRGGEEGGDRDVQEDDGDDSAGLSLEKSDPAALQSEVSWLALDCVALLSGTRPLRDVSGLGSDSDAGSTTRGYPTTARSPDVPVAGTDEVDAVSPPSSPLRGAAAFGLFLDLALFWPGRGMESCGGMSPGGKGRMAHRIRTLGSSSGIGIPDLVNLKLAALRYATWPPGGGLFGRDNRDDRGDDSDVSRAVILLLLSRGLADGEAGRGKGAAGESAMRSKLSRTSGGYLVRYHIGQSVQSVTALLRTYTVNKSKVKKYRKKKTSKSQQESISIGLAYSLLILILGEREAAPVLARYISLRHLWEDVLGPLPPTILNVARGDGPQGATRARESFATMTPERPVTALDDTDDGRDHDWDDGDEGVAASVAISDGDFRHPLLPKTSAAILDFVTKHFLDLGSYDLLVKCSDEEVGLLLELTLVSARRALRMDVRNDGFRQAHVMKHGWGPEPPMGAKALKAVCAILSQNSGTTRKSAAQGECLAIAMAGLFNVPAPEGAGPQNDIDDVRRNVLTGFMFGARARGREGRGGGIAAHIRGLQERGALLPPREVRRVCYGVMAELTPATTCMPMSPSPEFESLALPLDRLSLDAPMFLLRCVITEEEDLRLHAASALDSYLPVLASLLSSEDVISLYERGEAAQFEALAAPYLPVLLTAACSDSVITRLASARWAAEVVSRLDPLAACHLCAFLADDPDPKISKAARSCADGMVTDKDGGAKRRKTSMGALCSDAHAINQHGTSPKTSTVIFLDLKNDMDREVLYARLDQEVMTFSDQVGIPAGAGSVLLQHFKYRKVEAAETLLSDQEGTLARCGIEGRCRPALDSSARSQEDSCAAGTNIECGICFDEIHRQKEMYSMPCGHIFCRTCWQSYLDVSLEENHSLIFDLACPKEGCFERLTSDDVANIAPDLLGIWRYRRFASFVNMDTRHRFCPGPDCKMIAIASGVVSGLTASCGQCHTCFCFKCGERPHRPAECHDVEHWNNIFVSSKFWIKKNSKPCPGCKAPIVKEVGCNHMHCTRCDCQFCWVCLTDFHNELNSHICNKYDPSANDSTEEGRKTFYVTRFEAHDQAEKFAQTQLNAMPENLEMMKNESPFLSDKNSDVLKKAAEVLVESRCFLKHSYMVAYRMPEKNLPNGNTSAHNNMTLSIGDEKSQPSPTNTAPTQSPPKEAFVTHQGTLEKFTEKLSELSELDLAIILEQKGERSLQMHLSAINFHTQCVSKYIERINTFLRAR